MVMLDDPTVSALKEPASEALKKRTKLIAEEQQYFQKGRNLVTNTYGTAISISSLVQCNTHILLYLKCVINVDVNEIQSQRSAMLAACSEGNTTISFSFYVSDTLVRLRNRNCQCLMEYEMIMHLGINCFDHHLQSSQWLLLIDVSISQPQVIQKLLCLVRRLGQYKHFNEASVQELLRLLELELTTRPSCIMNWFESVKYVLKDFQEGTMKQADDYSEHCQQPSSLPSPSHTSHKQSQVSQQNVSVNGDLRSDPTLPSNDSVALIDHQRGELSVDLLNSRTRRLNSQQYKSVNDDLSSDPALPSNDSAPLIEHHQRGELTVNSLNSQTGRSDSQQNKSVNGDLSSDPAFPSDDSAPLESLNPQTRIDSKRGKCFPDESISDPSLLSWDSMEDPQPGELTPSSIDEDSPKRVKRKGAKPNLGTYLISDEEDIEVVYESSYTFTPYFPMMASGYDASDEESNGSRGMTPSHKRIPDTSDPDSAAWRAIILVDGSSTAERNCIPDPFQAPCGGEVDVDESAGNGFSTTESADGLELMEPIAAACNSLRFAVHPLQDHTPNKRHMRCSTITSNHVHVPRKRYMYRRKYGTALNTPQGRTQSRTRYKYCMRRTAITLNQVVAQTRKRYGRKYGTKIWYEQIFGTTINSPLSHYQSRAYSKRHMCSTANPVHAQTVRKAVKSNQPNPQGDTQRSVVSQVVLQPCMEEVTTKPCVPLPFAVIPLLSGLCKDKLEEIVRSRGVTAINSLLESLPMSPMDQVAVAEVLWKCEVYDQCPYKVQRVHTHLQNKASNKNRPPRRGDETNRRGGKQKTFIPRLEIHRLEIPRLEIPRLEIHRLEIPRLETNGDPGELHISVSSENVLDFYLEHCRTLPGCCDYHKLHAGVAGLHSSGKSLGDKQMDDTHHVRNGCLNMAQKATTVWPDGACGDGSQREQSGIPRRSVPLDGSTGRSTQKTVVTSLAKPTTADPHQQPVTHPRYHSRQHTELLSVASDCLHAQDYQRMYQLLLTKGNFSSLPLNVQVVYLFGCGLALFKMSKHKEACEYFRKAEDAAMAIGHQGDISLCNAYLGDTESSKKSYPAAVECYAKAIAHYSRDSVAQDWRMVPPSLSSLHAKHASALRNSSKAIDSVQAYKKAIAAADSKKDKLAAHTSLGNLYQSLGENESALTEYKEAIKLAEELQDNISLGWAHGNIGNAYLGLFQKDKGLHHLLISLDLTVQHEPTPQAIGRAYNNLGTAHQALNDLDKAQNYFDLALGQAIYGEDVAGQARVYGNIGNVLMINKSFERAIPHYSEVLRLSQDRSTVSTAYHNRGCSYYEWAENKKKSLLKRTAGEVTTFYLHLSDPADYGDVTRPPIIPDSILKYFRLGARDLEKVVKYHEVTLDNIKGSTRGLTLSISLFESNARTFHRLQDCLVSIGDWKKALVIAEQSRARSLGELLHKTNEHRLEESLQPPITLEQIFTVVNSQECPVVYLSYTGVRILAWVLVPNSEGVLMNMVEVPLEDDQFNGKSFDYHLRYSLTEALVEKSFEMYCPFDYQSSLNDPVRNLYKLIGDPLRKAFRQLKTPESETKPQKVIVIPDSYTNLIPFTCLLDPLTGHFLGDYYSFQIMPSLLSMGILDELPPATVSIPCTDSHSMCIIGNPSIPPFVYNGETWNLGKLPHAEREARWVANILKTTAILKEQATKSAILMRILHSKIIHIATHGSAAAGFLAFAGTTPFGSKEAVEARDVLLYPSDIEHLKISPALVVLSSCDSGRGTVKADGILGMARAFILAGAHAVLTTLWRVPDESASVFMQLFYQFLTDGFCSSEALQKATLSLRCFSKYSQYIHWSGYQLTGREVQVSMEKPDITRYLEARLGNSSVFPRLDIVLKLESSLIADHHGPTDVQILRGAPGMKPSEPLIDFVHSFHHHYKAGIFWINGVSTDLIDACLEYIQKVTGKCLAELHPSTTERLLVIIDNIEQLPPRDDLFKLLRNPNTHIVVISKYYTSPKALQKQVDQQLIRGCNIIDVMPLTAIHTTQQIAHAVLKEHHFAPQNDDQETFSRLAEFTSGSPCIISATTALLLSQLQGGDDPHESLRNFAKTILLDNAGASFKPKSVVSDSHKLNSVATGRQPSLVQRVRGIAEDVSELPSVYTTGDDDPWCTSAHYDSWQSISRVVQGCKLSAEEQLLLFCLSVFGCSPVPIALVTELSFVISKASRGSGNLLPKLSEMSLVKIYPIPVVLHSTVEVTVTENSESPFVYVPQLLSRALWKDLMTPLDRAATLATTYKALAVLHHNASPLERAILTGPCALLLEAVELNFDLMGRECYSEVYKLFIQMKVHNMNIVPADLDRKLQDRTR